MAGAVKKRVKFIARDSQFIARDSRAHAVLEAWAR
jgi:hypothetical protein